MMIIAEEVVDMSLHLAIEMEYDKKNISMYNRLISNNGSEYNIWEGKSNFEGLSEDLISAINKIRTGDFWFIPGYDANYGRLKFNA